MTESVEAIGELLHELYGRTVRHPQLDELAGGSLLMLHHLGELPDAGGRGLGGRPQLVELGLRETIGAGLQAKPCELGKGGVMTGHRLAEALETLGRHLGLCAQLGQLAQGGVMTGRRLCQRLDAPGRGLGGGS